MTRSNAIPVKTPDNNIALKETEKSKCQLFLIIYAILTFIRILSVLETICDAND